MADIPTPAEAAEIAVATVADSDGLAALHEACFASPWSRDAIATLVTTLGGFALLARVDGAAVGFVVCRVAADEAEMLCLGVAPAFRDRGIGRALTEAAAGWAAALDAATLYLEVAEDNAPARRLYDRAGFASVGRRPGYYRRPGDAPVDALVLGRGLDDHRLSRRRT